MTDSTTTQAATHHDHASHNPNTSHTSNTPRKQRLHPNWLLYLVMLLIFIKAFHQHLLIEPDTGTYLNFDAMRPPLLPIVLWLIRKIAGHHWLSAYHITYLGLTFFAFAILDIKLRKQFRLPIYFTIPLIACLLIYNCLPFDRSVLSINLSLPLFVLSFTYLLVFFSTYAARPAILFSLFTALLILTRAQFYFMYGFFILGIGIMLYQRVSKNVVIKIGAIFLASILLTNAFNRVYHYAHNRQWGVSSAVGLQFIVQPLFFSKASDAAFFKDAYQRRVFLALHQKANENNLLYSNYLQIHGHTPTYQLNSFYFNDYNAIIGNTIDVLYNQFHITNQYAQSALLQSIAFTLIKHRYREFFCFLIYRVYKACTGTYQLGLLLLLFSLSLFIFFKNPGNQSALVSLLSLVFFVVNPLFVGIFETELWRYFVYSYITLGISFTVLLFDYYEKAIQHKPTSAQPVCAE